MGFDRFLNHRVSIVREVVTLDGSGNPTLDSYGQPVVSAVTLASSVAAGIQPKSARERAALNQAGVAASDHTIFLRPRDVSTADTIVHDADTCPLTTDLPTSTYQVVGLPDAAGAGHHLEVAATLVGATQSAYATPVGS